MANTTTKRRRTRRHWTSYLEEDFTPESVQMVAIPMPPRRGEPSFPKAVTFRPTRRDAARYRELMGLTENQKPIILQTAGFFAKPGVKDLKTGRVKGGLYDCRVSGHPKYVLCFPANYLAMQGEEWRPEPVVLNVKLTFVRDELGRWFSRHPETGQKIYPFKLDFQATGKVPMIDPRTGKPKEVEVTDESGEKRIEVVMTDAVEVDMSRFMIKPILTQSRWSVGRPEVMTKVKPHELVAYFNDDIAADARLSVTDFAPSFDIFGSGDGKDGLTILEVFGSPIGHESPAKSLEELLDRIFAWLHEIREDFFPRLVAATHEEWFPADWTAAERSRAQAIAAKTTQETELLAQWAAKYFKYLGSYLAARRAGGKSIGGFRIPQPYGRELGSMVPLAELKVLELRTKFHEAVQPAKAKPPKTAETKERPKETRPKRTNKSPRAEPTTPHVSPEERLVISTGVVPNTLLAEKLKEVGLIKPATANDDGEKSRSNHHYQGICSVCHRRSVKTTDPELEDKVVPGAVCNSCKNKKKKNRDPRHDHSSREYYEDEA
jgi:hypothetical protein